MGNKGNLFIIIAIIIVILLNKNKRNVKSKKIEDIKIPTNDSKDIKPLNHIISKYEKKGDVYFDKDPLPDLYYVNEIVLMPKNKDTLYAYWEIREDDYIKLKNEHNIFDTATINLYKNGKLARSIKGLPRIGSYYIKDIEAGMKYVTKIGFENDNGKFFEVKESKEIKSPAGKVSENNQTSWSYVIKKEDGTIEIKYYDIFNLPEDELIRLEITDNKLLKDEKAYNDYVFNSLKEASLKNGLENSSSMIFMGSSNTIWKK